MTDATLHYHVVGGNNRYGMGMNCGVFVYESDQQKFVGVIDMGLMPSNPRSPEAPGLVDAERVMPDYFRLFRNRHDEKHQPDLPADAVFLTHAHPDHASGIPAAILAGCIINKVYATPYNAIRLQQELSNEGIPPEEWPKIFKIAPGAPLREGDVEVSAFWVSHSTPHSVGYHVKTPEGNILHTGDFKLDDSVTWGPAFNEGAYRSMVKDKPVDLLVMDSTGADRDVNPVTENDVREALRDIMQIYPDKRFVVAVMSGFEETFASVAQVTAENGRQFWATGWNHEQVVDALNKTGLTLGQAIGTNVNVNFLGTDAQARNFAAVPADKSVIVVTGAQGQPSAALPSAVDGKNKLLQLDPKTDIILMCAPTMPGHEASRARLMANLAARGFKVLTRNDAELYSHAHARLPEILSMAALTGAKTVLPAHGDAELRASCDIALTAAGQTTVNAANGQVIRVTKNGSYVVNPDQEPSYQLIGMKTYSGREWWDRTYIYQRAASNENMPTPKPVTKDDRHRPSIFWTKGKGKPQ